MRSTGQFRRLCEAALSRFKGADGVGRPGEAPSKPPISLVIGALHDVPGGAERVLVDVANGLHRRGYPVTVITYQDQNGPSYYPLDFGIRRLDGRRRDVRRPKASPLHSFTSVTQRRRLVAVVVWLALYVPRIVALRRMLRISRSVVAIGFMPSTFPYLVAAAPGVGTRTIASLHNVPVRELGGDPARWDQNPVDIWFRNRALRHADAVTVLLPSFREQIEPRVQPSTFVVPNMIARHDGDLANVESDDAGNRILAVGRLSPAKDHETLIRAWSAIRHRFPTWRLEIFGDGPLASELDDLIESLGTDRISIEEPTPAISDVYTSSKFLVMPSLFEGFGLVTAEAMSHGLPVIGFADCEGTNEIVLHDQNGLLVEPGGDRIAALSESMATMIEDEHRRIRLASSAPGTVTRFDPGTVLDRWEELIGRIAG